MTKEKKGSLGHGYVELEKRAAGQGGKRKWKGSAQRKSEDERPPKKKLGKRANRNRYISTGESLGEEERGGKDQGNWQQGASGGEVTIIWKEHEELVRGGDLEKR